MEYYLEQIPVSKISAVKRNQQFSPQIFTDQREKFVRQGQLCRGIQKKAMHNTSMVQTVVQMGKKRYGSRPGFKSYILVAGRKIKLDLGGRPFDMAHRLSFRDIRTIMEHGTLERKQALVEALTIPQRDFGEIPAGDLTLYDQIMELDWDTPEALSALNSSCFNLRPGIPSINRSIGARPDLHHEGNDPDRPLTPQSAKLSTFALDRDPGKSSDFLTPEKLTKAEHELTAGLS